MGQRVGFFGSNLKQTDWDRVSDPVAQTEPCGTMGQRTRPHGPKRVLAPSGTENPTHGSPETQATNAHPAKRKKTGHGTQPRAPKGRDRE